MKNTLFDELPKYRIVFEGLSILPFALRIGIYYIPENKKVGEITGFFGNIKGWLQLQYPPLYIEFKEGRWVVQNL